MEPSRARLLFVFVDGVGLAPAGPENPLSTVAMPALAERLGGPLVEGVDPAKEVVLRSMDATLGVEGLPQSATGQTALLTGVNAAALLGFHQAAFPGARLQQILATDSLFRRLAEGGVSCTFANAFLGDPYERGRRGRLSASTRAMMAAGLPFRRLAELRRDRAITWDVCRDRWNRSGSHAEPIAAREAGGHLASLAAAHDVTLFETFMTDLAGHGRWGWTAEEALSRLDGLLAGVGESADPELTVVLTSDHGNLEAAGTRLHTRNPVPLVSWGPARQAFDGAVSLLDVAPAILGLFRRTPVAKASDLL